MKSKVLANFVVSLLVLSQFFLYPVLAEESSISENGKGSSNEISIKNEESKTVEQSNNAEISNQVESETQTGNNETPNNSGETEITTGNASTEVAVVNSGNTNQVQAGCCPTSGGSAQITGNGTDSSNQINSDQKSSTVVSQNNGAQITNNIVVNANTGDNEVSDNTGDVSIATGSVNTKIGVLNSVNNSYASVGGGLTGLNLKIAGNGTGSSNNVEENYDDTQDFFVNNYLELNNNFSNYSNTGGNRAKGNLGSVKISTGNIYLDIILSNRVNSSLIIADCGCKSPSPSPTPTPSGSPGPSNPPSGGGSGGGSGGSSSGGSGGSSDSGSSSGSSSGGGQVLGVTLPATGGFSLIQATLFALSLLGSGIILRLDFGKKKTYAKKIKKQITFDNFYGFEKMVGKRINWKFPAPVPRNLFTDFKNLPSPSLLANLK